MTNDTSLTPTNKPYFPHDDRVFVARETEKILETGVLTMGPWVKELEKEAAEQIGTEYVVTTNSGTSALEILLRYNKLAPGDEVIVPTNTFVATANAVSLAGGIPVLADISAETLSIDPSHVEKLITPKTRGVICVHIAGIIACDFAELKSVCEENNLFLLEDAAHAYGAQSAYGTAGTLGDGAAFSLFPTKPVTAGEGGLIATNDHDCALFAQSYRCHGIDTVSGYNQFIQLGHNFRMSEITALVGCTSIRRNGDAQKKRNEIAQVYLNSFGSSMCATPIIVKDSYPAWFKFPVILPQGVSKATVKSKLARAGVSSNTCYWPPVHRQPFYAQNPTVGKDAFPVADTVLDRTIAIPLYPSLDVTRAQYIADTLNDIVNEENSK